MGLLDALKRQKLNQEMAHTESYGQGDPDLEAYLASKETPTRGVPLETVTPAEDMIGGPVKLGVLGAGVLKQIPWERAATRLPDLQRYAEALKRQFQNQLKLTEQFGVEHGIRGGIEKPGEKLLIRRNIGDENSLVNRTPQGITRLSGTGLDFHTHPTGRSVYGSSAEPSAQDLRVWTQRNRGNQENIVAAPDEDYLWWTIPKGKSPRQLNANPETNIPSREEVLARILHSAKKGDWDVQTSIDPRIYGVKP